MAKGTGGDRCGLKEKIARQDKEAVSRSTYVCVIASKNVVSRAFALVSRAREPGARIRDLLVPP
jgi:hypothetical protein